MADMTITINPEPLFALLGENGEHWLQGGWGDDDQMCLHGAIRRCSPQPGDAFIIEQVANRFGWGTDWNDSKDTNWTMVRERIVAGIEVTDAMLADTFGPQWEAMVALVRRAAVLTADEAHQLAAAWDAAGAQAGDAAWAAAWDAAGVDARDAARALALRDLIGQHGFTQGHYDLLTRPWATVIGPVHPDDKEADRD